MTFIQAGQTPPPAEEPTWSIGTEIVHPKVPNVPGDERDGFEPDENETLGGYSSSGTLRTGIGFEEYVKEDASIDWEGLKHRHVCIHLDHKGSHQQLWVLRNPTQDLHNFHIHQMKFRLATRHELIERYHIKPPAESHTCPDNAACTEPDYKFYEEDREGTALSHPVWHDTIPVPTGNRPVFLIMSFDAKEQIGRFVFHCHILKHEDNGLMAPIEVWGGPFPKVDR